MQYLDDMSLVWQHGRRPIIAHLYELHLMVSLKKQNKRMEQLVLDCPYIPIAGRDIAPFSKQDKSSEIGTKILTLRCDDYAILF